MTSNREVGECGAGAIRTSRALQVTIGSCPLVSSLMNTASDREH